MAAGWPVDRTCIPVADNESTADAAVQRAAEQLAVDVLWALSGRQFGIYTVKARPCPNRRNVGPLRYGPDFYLVFDGQRWNGAPCGCAGSCSYASPSVVHLSGGELYPAQSVIEVRLADVVLAPSAYVLEGSRLYRADGSAWPSQNLARPLGLDGTWSVTYTRGVPPPEGTAKFAGTLAAEFLAACRGQACKLPRRLRTISRGGVSFEMVDPVDIYREHRTGFTEIDLWISAVNPAGLAEPPTVR